MKRGRKQDDSLPPSRSREVQRAFRQRRADYIAGLEHRVRELEEEADSLRARLGEVPVYATQPEVTGRSKGKAKALIAQIGAASRHLDFSGSSADFGPGSPGSQGDAQDLYTFAEASGESGRWSPTANKNATSPGGSHHAHSSTVPPWSTPPQMLKGAVCSASHSPRGSIQYASNQPLQMDHSSAIFPGYAPAIQVPPSDPAAFPPRHLSWSTIGSTFDEGGAAASNYNYPPSTTYDSSEVYNRTRIGHLRDPNTTPRSALVLADDAPSTTRPQFGERLDVLASTATQDTSNDTSSAHFTEFLLGLHEALNTDSRGRSLSASQSRAELSALAAYHPMPEASQVSTTSLPASSNQDLSQQAYHTQPGSRPLYAVVQSSTAVELDRPRFALLCTAISSAMLLRILPPFAQVHVDAWRAWNQMRPLIPRAGFLDVRTNQSVSYLGAERDTLKIQFGPREVGRAMVWCHEPLSLAGVTDKTSQPVMVRNMQGAPSTDAGNHEMDLKLWIGAVDRLIGILTCLDANHSTPSNTTVPSRTTSSSSSNMKSHRTESMSAFKSRTSASGPGVSDAGQYQTGFEQHDEEFRSGGAEATNSTSYSQQRWAERGDLHSTSEDPNQPSSSLKMW